MPMEQERRFLVTETGDMPAYFQEMLHGNTTLNIKQGYLTPKGKPTTRIRITAPARTRTKYAHLCLKFDRNEAGEVPEFEYAIPLTDAEQMMEYCGGRVVTKKRILVPLAQPKLEALALELDIFTGRQTGLVILEVEKPESYTQRQWAAVKFPDEILALPELTNVKGWSNRKLADLNAVAAQ